MPNGNAATIFDYAAAAFGGTLGFGEAAIEASVPVSLAIDAGPLAFLGTAAVATGTPILGAVDEVASQIA